MPEGSKGQTRDKVATYVGLSGRTLEKATAVVEAAKQDPERFDPVVAQMDRTRKVNAAYKQFKKLEIKDIQREPPALPTGPSRVIAADPPWTYTKRPEDLTHRSSLGYPAMSTAAICELPVASIAHEDCVLWLWTTNAHMREAFDVLVAWGFEHKTILTWVKSRFGTGTGCVGKPSTASWPCPLCQ